jgi:hypothetical protein
MTQDDDRLWEATMRHIEKERGYPLSTQERKELDGLRKDVERFMAEATNKIKAAAEARRHDPLIAFMQKLKDRQGTITPDFDTLYRRKAELDGEA